MIDLQSISYSVNHKILFNSLDFKLPESEKCVISGPSGSGKSTLLMMIAGLTNPDSGSITVNKWQVLKENLERIRSEIAFIGQEPVMGAETVEEALKLPFQFKTNRHQMPAQKTLDAALEQTGLEKQLLSRRTELLSGGEKQRVAISRAILLNKSIFLADEITSALDSDNKQLIINFFTRNRNITLLSISHDSDWINTFSHHYTLSNGKLIKQETNNGSG